MTMRTLDEMEEIVGYSQVSSPCKRGAFGVHRLKKVCKSACRVPLEEVPLTVYTSSTSKIHKPTDSRSLST